MKSLYFLLLLLTHLCAGATTFYLSPDGNNKNPGTITKPFATIQKAQSFLHPGDTLYMRGGIYHMTEDLIAHTERIYACLAFLDKSGRPGKYINYWAYPGEKPVFDYTAVKPNNLRVAAFYVTGSWLHFKGFEITGVQVTIKTHTQSECFENHGSNNIYEQLSMHDGMAIGFYLLSGSDNLILNCDAYRNFDSVSENGRGGNTDGFGCHPAAGSKGNVFRGCRSWFNSDDGYDVINSHEGTTFDHCWAFYNGYNATFTSEGDGNGFKGGGYGHRPSSEFPDPIPRNTIQFCVAVRNKASGFYSNHHPGGSVWLNNTAYKNHIDFNMLNRQPDGDPDVPRFRHALQNNLGYKGGRELANLDSVGNLRTNNSFDAPQQPTDDDFISLDETQLTAPRRPDGSLPVITFLHPKPGSPFASMGAFTNPNSTTANSPGTNSLNTTSPGINFSGTNSRWIPEIEQKPNANSSVYTHNDTLFLDTRGGVTVWLDKKLSGHYQIDYDRTILLDSGRNCRLSDCNQFWLAADPRSDNLFTRSGKLEDYDNLELFYVGMGGNTNKTTRFRKYAGGVRSLLKEYLDTAHLLKANINYHLTITVTENTTAFLVDGDPWFTYTSPTPFPAGYFGFRSTWSRQAIRNFRITPLP